MKRLCLISPPRSYLVNPRMQTPLGLLYVAAAAQEAGHDVVIWDTVDLHVQSTMYVPEADVYGFTATAVDYARDVEAIASVIRIQKPEAKIVLGGPIWLSPEVVNFRLIDTLVCGDGEQAIVELLSMDDWPTTLRSGPADVKTCPEPARELWPGSLGGAIFAGGKSFYDGGSTTIATSRGCPYQCAFCANALISGRRIRYRPVDDVVAEMERCVRDFKIRQFRFSDETINANSERLVDFCRAIQRSKTLYQNIAWRCSLRAGYRMCGVRMLEEMVEAGCKEVAIGIESADPHVLEVLKKGVTVSHGWRALEAARSAGLYTRALMIVGTPGESPKTLKCNLRFLLDAPYDLVSMTIFVPFPGCDIWHHPEEYNCDLVNKDLSTYNLYYYNDEGARQVKPYVKLWDFDYALMASNLNLMRSAALGLGKLNRG